MQSTATNVKDYLASLPGDRRATLEAVRKVILKNLDSGYEEGMQYGMIGYYVPHRLFPAGYHTDPKQPLPFAALASQKNYCSLYMMGVYCGCGEGAAGETPHARWFREAWIKTGKKLDMGKACVRFRTVDDVALEVVGEAIRRMPADGYVATYQEMLARTRGGATNARKPATKKPAAMAPVTKSKAKP
jgi:hypothetical protein